jgi:hypothetical protein
MAESSPAPEIRRLRTAIDEQLDDAVRRLREGDTGISADSEIEQLLALRSNLDRLLDKGADDFEK